MRSLPDLPVFSRDEARAFGWSDSAVSRAVRSGRLIAVRRGYLARPDTIDERVIAAAAVSAVAESVVSHRSALLMHDLPIVGQHAPRPEITVNPNRSGSAYRALLHRATLTADDVVVVAGVPVTSVGRTVFDVARARPTATGVAAIDAALNRKLVTIAELDAVALRCWNWPGIRRALRALRLSDGRAESALESVSRLVIGWLGLPAPEPQVLLLDQFGHPAGRVDFYWDEFGVAGESDGKLKYRDPEARIAEKYRQERLEDDSLVFVRWGWDQPVHHPQLLRARLLNGFKRGQARDRSGFPRLWSVAKPEPNSSGEDVIVGRAAS